MDWDSRHWFPRAEFDCKWRKLVVDAWAVASAYALSGSDVVSDGFALICWKVDDAEKILIESRKAMKNLLESHVYRWG